jgi:hypothetical protein
MKPLLFVCAIVLSVVNCATSRPPTNDLAKSLVLLHAPIEKLQIGSNIDVRSAIRNISNESIDVCVDDSGVSLWLEDSHQRPMWPIMLGGLILDARCPRRTRLDPGGELQFHSSGGVSRHLQPGDATLRLSIRLSQPTGRHSVTISAAENVRLVAP